MIDAFFCGALDVLILWAFTFRGPSFGRTAGGLALIGFTWVGIGAPIWLFAIPFAAATALLALHARYGGAD